MTNKSMTTKKGVGRRLRPLMLMFLFLLTTTAAAVAPAAAFGDIKVLSLDGDWITVDLGFIEGYVQEEYLDIDKEKLQLDEEAELFRVTPEPTRAVQQPDAPPAAPAAAIVIAEPQEDLSDYELYMRKAVASVVSFLQTLERRDDIGVKEKMEKAIEFIRYIRWGPEKRFYFWIVDVEGMMILEPQYPYTEGKNVLSYRDLNQRHIFGEFIRASLQSPYGHVKHHGLGYDGNKSNARLSVVKLFKPWEWVVGIGEMVIRVETWENDELPIRDHLPASPI